jgi:hypothetical protein
MPHKVFVSIPAYGQTVTVATAMTSLGLVQTFASRGIAAGFSMLSFPDIAELRGMFMTIWYDTMPDSTHLLFVDNDMAFPPDMVIDMLVLDEPLVGTIYRQRRDEITWAGSGTNDPMTERRGGFMRVEGVGMGCTLIRRDLVVKMIEKYPELVDVRVSQHPAIDLLKQAGASRLFRFFEKLDIPDRGVISEDLSFCIRWRQCGGDVWGGIGYNIAHVGPYAYTGCYSDYATEQMAKQEAVQAALAAQAVQPQEKPVELQAAE